MIDEYFEIKTDKNPLTYSCGETAVFTIRCAKNHEPRHCGKYKWVLRGDDGSVKEGFGKSIRGRSFKIEGTCKTAGFLHLTVTALKENGEVDASYSAIDAGAGFDIDKIKFHGNIPEDYDEFWGEIEKEIKGFTPTILYKKPITNMVDDGFEAYDIRISTPLDMPASGILTFPKGTGKLPATVEFLGYGIDPVPPECVDGRINFFLNAHGFENNLNAEGLKKKYPHLSNYGYIKEENESPHTTYWKSVIIRDLVAAKFIRTLDNWDGINLTAKGGSQGGFRATNVAAHDGAVNFLDINVPWFCDLTAENHGFMKGSRPEYQEGLAYYDTAAAITRVKCPVRIGARLGDYVCPPSTVMALYNNCTTLKSLDFIQCWTHSYFSPQLDSFRIYSDPENPDDILKGKQWQDTAGNKFEVLGEFKDIEGKFQALCKFESGEGMLFPKEIWSDILYINGSTTRRFTEIR
ncbi:MAG: acetylxylan esterase [Clostridia bacterium]|nr:acetylxylan esterase [Clostridia bacterium]